MKRQLKLSRVERWILSNQYRIFEMLTGDEKDKEDLAFCRKAIDCGYMIEYNRLAEHISDVEFSRKQSSEAIEILQMFYTLDVAYRKIKDKSGINTDLICFHGYDYNDETELRYARFTQYWCARGSYEDLLRRMKDAKVNEFNSHRPMLGVYRHMLSAWMPIQRKHETLANVHEDYTKADIVKFTTACLQARTHAKHGSGGRPRPSQPKVTTHRGTPRLRVVKADEDE